MKHEHLIVNIDVATAILLLVVAVVLWIQLRRSVTRSTWIVGLITLVFIVLHCFGHYTDTIFLTHITAVSNAALVLVLVMLLRRNTRKAAELEEEVIEQQEVIQHERSAAAELAIILTEYRARIEALESKGKVAVGEGNAPSPDV